MHDFRARAALLALLFVLGLVIAACDSPIGVSTSTGSGARPTAGRKGTGSIIKLPTPTRQTQAAAPTAGSTGDADNDGIPDNVDQCPNDPENYNKVFDYDGCPDTIFDLIGVARDDINQYWAGEFQGSGLQYAGPRLFQAYTPSRPLQTGCGVTIPDNAFYCDEDHSIYYDAAFLQDQLDRVGDFAPVTIIAHEWGHLIQADIGIVNSDQIYTIDKELQADCFAGAWSESADQQGMVEKGDLEEGTQALYEAGDDINTPWFDPQAHGQPAQRFNSFVQGFQNGAQYCIDNLGKLGGQ